MATIWEFLLLSKSEVLAYDGYKEKIFVTLLQVCVITNPKSHTRVLFVVCDFHLLNCLYGVSVDVIPSVILFGKFYCTVKKVISLSTATKFSFSLYQTWQYLPLRADSYGMIFIMFKSPSFWFACIIVPFAALFCKFF